MKRINTIKTNEESIKDFQEKLNLGFNFVDYFLTIGVKPEIFLNQWLYDSSIEELNSIYKEKLMPEIINKFPSFEKKIIGIDETIIQHCFPLGFKVQEFSYERPPNKIFSILLDNNNFSEIHQFKFAICLICYESINDYRKLYEKYHNNASINVTNNKNNNLNNSVCLGENGLFTFSDNMSVLSNNTCFNKINNKIINNFSMLSTNTPFSDFTQKETNVSSFLNNKTYRKYYIPKCICLISIHPFIIELTKILNSIYQYSQLDRVEIPLEKIINNLVLEVPKPPRGLYSIEYSLFDKTYILQNSRLNNLFFATVEFDKLFMRFKTEQILIIFQYLMLGIKIVFFSSKIEQLTPIIFSMLILVFPFKYPFPVVSVLPKESYNLIDNITPEILGVNEKFYHAFFTDNDIDITDHLLVVDIDEQVLVPLKPKNLEELPSLPKKLKEDLFKKIIKYISEIQNKKKGEKKESIKMFQYIIRNYFLEFQAELLKNYPLYLNNNIYKHPYEKPFKVKKFLTSVSKSDYAFYEKFIETQMFNDYITQRMMPKDKEEQTSVLYFEEKIFELNNMNNKIIYLNSNLFNFNNVYKVPKVKPCLKDDLLYFYKNEKNHKMLLLDGILMNNNLNNENISNYNTNKQNQNQNNSNSNQPYFSYILFPKLKNDFFFENEIKTYYLDLSIFNEIKNNNSELISKSHLNRVENQTNEITNYVYILWLKVWAHTFYYHDKKEQKYRYLQMIKVFNKINQHEMNVLSNLFQSLIKANADEDMIFHLYIKILQCKLSPSIDIFNTIKNLIRKKTKNHNLNSTEISKYLSYKAHFPVLKKDLNKKDFRKRTMKNIYDMYINEKVTFLFEEICDNCDKKIDIYNFLKNINNINNDIVWAKCPFCLHSYLPKIKVIYGDEINKNDKLKQSTSIVDEVILYSPKTLKTNFIDNSNIDIDKLKLNYYPIFWNLVYYFKINKLPFDFILPYQDNIFKLKKKNINYYKVTFSQNDHTLVKKPPKLELNSRANTETNNFATNLKLNNFTNKTPIIKSYNNSYLSQMRNIDNNVKARTNNNISTNFNNNLSISLNKFGSPNLQAQNTINHRSNYKMPYVNKIIKLNSKPQSSSNLMVNGLINTPSRNASNSINKNYNNAVLYTNSNFNTSYNKLTKNIFSVNNYNQLKLTHFTNLVKPINNNINKQPFINIKKINYYPNSNTNSKKSFDFSLNKRYVILNYNNIKGVQNISSSYIYK